MFNKPRRKNKMNEEMGELEKKIKEAMKNEQGKLNVYRLFKKYEDCVASQNLTPQEEDKYLNLYLEYMRYINKTGAWN